MRSFRMLKVFLYCSIIYADAVMATEITRGIMLSNSCAACHGTEGRSPGAIPRISDKSAASIVQALYEFRAGTRPATVMKRHVMGYTDEEIQLIADYFSSQNNDSL